MEKVLEPVQYLFFLYNVQMETTKKYPSDITREQFEYIRPIWKGRGKELVLELMICMMFGMGLITY